MKKYFVFLSVFILSIGVTAQDFNQRRIQPYKNNNYYWQYHGKPVLLIGGSSNHNLFQNDKLEEELDLIHSVRGNYVRNTMAFRDEGNVFPFVKEGELYNPDKFNKEYWDKFERFLKLTSERNIFVQIEIWAQHDFNRGWLYNPWNPSNNMVITETNTKLKAEIIMRGQHYHSNFFYSVPKLNNDELLLSYQQKFVDKLLSISLQYDHVLYCITNEIFSHYPPAWGWYWAEYIKGKARKAGVGIEVTEMYQEVDIKHEQHRASLDNPGIYSYLDMSQNSANFNQDHWDNLQWVREYISDNPRPINHTKTYGGLLGNWTGGPNHGIERFWRNIIGGAASVRFHRPQWGIGISERAQRHIKSASMLINEYDIFTSVPDANSTMLLERMPDEAYLAKNKDNSIVVYFPDGGDVMLNLCGLPGTYRLRWLNIEAHQWREETTITGGNIVQLRAPYAGNWLALITFINS